MPFMVWLAFRDRLSTGDRMKNWGIEQCCMLCGERNENRYHLFFACPFSFTVWLNIAGKLMGSAITLDWNDTVASLFQPDRSWLNHVLRRMVFQTVLYSVWKEQNSWRHGGVWVMTEKLTRIIDKQIRNWISSLRYTKDHLLEGMMRRWLEVT